MFAITCLFTCALTTAQLQGQADQLLTPRFVRGQELTYRGTFVEEAGGPRAQLSRSYRLEARIFVLDTPPSGADLAILTVLRLHDGRAEPGDGIEPSSVRLELARADLQGRLAAAAPGTTLSVPLDGPPTIECGAVVEFPRGGLAFGKSWEAADPGSPRLLWKVVGTESVNGTTCVKLLGLQQSPSWDQPRGDRAAWRRQETVWLSPRLGVAYRVERTIEHREPGHVEPTGRAQTRYELESPLQYPGKLYEDRKREILLAQALYERVAPMLPEPGKFGPQPFDKVLARIKDHEDVQPPTPYREAIDQVKRRVEAARRGESPPATLTGTAAPAPSVATIGYRAPEFLVANFLTGQSMTLRGWLGKPVVMVFYSPTSATAEESLRFAQRLSDQYRQEVTVLGFVFGEDAERVRQQCSELQLTFPLLAGKGLRTLYGIDATPKVIVLDGQGIVRATYVGWGREMPGAITEELRRWLGRGQSPGAVSPDR